ncbi:MAG: cupin domain-containing protein [Firmicutes bacterium]|nr:cupin domain-containing protein [Bacillota bacterium]
MKIGEKIKRLRIQNGLTQEELADRCELTKGFISQVERDLTSPSIATLVDILSSLGTNLKDFFDDRIQEKLVFTADDIFTKENSALKHEIDWIVPNAQKNMMEPIVVTLESGGRTEKGDPHDGEEFGYMLKGVCYLHLGNKKHRVSAGECFYFKPNAVHYLANESKSRAKILWVSTPPSF